MPRRKQKIVRGPDVGKAAARSAVSVEAIRRIAGVTKSAPIATATGTFQGVGTSAAVKATRTRPSHPAGDRKNRTKRAPADTRRRYRSALERHLQSDVSAWWR